MITKIGWIEYCYKTLKKAYQDCSGCIPEKTLSRGKTKILNGTSLFKDLYRRPQLCVTEAEVWVHFILTKTKEKSYFLCFVWICKLLKILEFNSVIKCNLTGFGRIHLHNSNSLRKEKWTSQKACVLLSTIALQIFTNWGHFSYSLPHWLEIEWQSQ